MSNPLTRQAGLKIGPVVLETLIKHYFERIKKDTAKNEKVHLRQDELLYDEAFIIIKTFLETASYHTVEEVQAFSNTRTPSPPWVHVVRLVVPMSSCDDAAVYLIKALGGEDVAKRVVGGTKWWQVRGVSGVNAQWITARKDWREAKKKYKAHKERSPAPAEKSTSPDSSSDDASGEAGDPEEYEEGMDEMRCILYAHGGGYYFGSVDQERYSIQRHARKVNGRVFAVDYRLAPQYPFPCALQDLLAAYLFLIRPPPNAAHRPVKPSHIVVMGDSAGGGLALALLQVIRDVDLPLPGGGVLISPWCDLTHSFPSVHTNTATDVIPVYGLSLQKPSTLWPPPPDEMTNRVHASLRSRIRQVVRPDGYGHRKEESHVALTEEAVKSASSGMPVDVGATASLPPLDSSKDQTISCTAKDGTMLAVDDQVHLYAPNNLMCHPLISPALSYLGGLPPLFFIASDREVLRDEIIYTAHRAADPAKYPLREDARQMYPALEGIESRCKATPVHLQVYDDTAHVLPVLFSFSTPAKYCFRAIASFVKHVTGMTSNNPLNPTSPTSPTINMSSMFPIPVSQKSITLADIPGLPITTSPEPLTPYSSNAPEDRREKDGCFHSTPPKSNAPQDAQTSRGCKSIGTDATASIPSSFRSPRLSIRRSLSTIPARAASMIRRDSSTRPRSRSFIDEKPQQVRRPSVPAMPDPPSPSKDRSADVGGPRFAPSLRVSGPDQDEDRFAGDSVVYSETPTFPWDEGMIRERVSTRGVIRSLEPEAELTAFQVPSAMIGVLSELALRRYIEGRTKFNKKFAGTIHTIEKHRQRNLELAKKDTLKNMTQLQGHISQQNKESSPEARSETKKGIVEGLMAASGSWSWAWALDGDERPPPSSIVSRRDTSEARRLARIADQPFLQEDQPMSGNNLWSVIVNFLTVTPDKGKLSMSVGSEGKTRLKFTRLMSKHKARRRSAEVLKSP